MNAELFVKNPLKIGIIAGEPSGDLLGARLLALLRQYFPNLIVEGIGGSEMQKAGCKSLFPMEKLSVMGLIEPLFNLREILSIRHAIKKHFLQNPPDIFIGIDAPDFNLNVEATLKKAGILVIHYVSPSIWAWRPGRIHTIKKSVDLMLCLLPFEPALYEAENIKAIFMGHPLAQEVSLDPCFHRDEGSESRRQEIPTSSSLRKQGSRVLTVLPGSRSGEIKQLGHLFLTVAQQCQAKILDLKILIPMINEQRFAQFNTMLKKHDIKNVELVLGNSREAMAEADVILLASGTATLEAMLLKKPMVVAYKVSALTYWIGKLLVKIKYFAFPNILNKRKIVPEFIQHQATLDNLTEAILKAFNENHSELIKNFEHWHEVLAESNAEQLIEFIKCRLKHLPT